MTSIIGIIGAILSGIDMIAFISLFLYYKPNKEAKVIDNDTKVSDELQKIVDTLQEELNNKNESIKEKDEKIDSLWDECLKKDAIISKLEIENIKLAQWKCDVRGCINRQPPNGL